MAAAKPPMVVVEKDPANAEIVIVTLQKEPVNSMNFALWEALYKAVEPLNKDPSVRAIIFKSGLKKNVGWTCSRRVHREQVPPDQGQNKSTLVFFPVKIEGGTRREVRSGSSPSRYYYQ